MKKIIFLAIAFTVIACNKSNDVINTTIPNCIQNIIDDSISSNDLKTIRVQEVDKELHYWLNTDIAHSDGVEYIVTSKCDTICGLCGECILPECYEDYTKNWTVIWED